MFFNSSMKQSFGMMIFCVLALTACDSKIGEKPPPPVAQEFGGTQCLSDAKPVIKDFVAGTAKQEDLEAAWDCAISAVEKFKRYVRGNTADRYTSQELATFLERNFLAPQNEVSITPKLQVELMKIKQIFVGGSREYLTRVELDKTISMFTSFRSITVSLNPYMKVIALNWKVSERASMQNDIHYFEAANDEIQNAARTLASLIEKNAQGYELSDFVVLMQEMSEFFGEKWEFPSIIDKYMPVIKKVKKALAGGDEGTVTPNEWGRFTLLGARGYVQFLRYHYFIKLVSETGTGYRLAYLARSIEDFLSVFQDLVSEKPEGFVSRGEITDLLKTLSGVWPEFKISAGLVFESMKIKQLFFGGSIDSLSTTDFQRARLKISQIKSLVEHFMPYYFIYGMEWDPEMYGSEEAQKLFMESQFVLESTLRELGVLFEGAYDLNDVLNFLHEIERLYPSEKEPLSGKVKSYLPLVLDVKNMIFGSHDSVLRKEDWSVLLSFKARLYSDYLYYRYFLAEKSFIQPVNLEYLTSFADQSLNILRDIIQLKKQAQFSREELRRIVMHLLNLEIIPSGLSSDSVNRILDVLLNNILLSPEHRLQGLRPNALTLSSIEVLRQELKVWLESEKMFAQIAQLRSVGQGFSGNELLEILRKKQQESDISKPLRIALKELVISADSPVEMSFDSRGHLNISNKVEQLYDLRSLRQLNFNRALARLLIRSFGSDLKKINTYEGVTLLDMEEAFKKVRPIFIDLGVLDPANLKFATSRFRESNIFVPHSDGNSLASHAELTDLVGMIWSGLAVHSELRKELVKKCFSTNEVVTEKSLVRVSCARGAYRDIMPEVMSSTPEFVKFMRAADADSWAYYMNNIFMAAGYVPNDKGLAKMSDISLTPHVIQYVEMIYARFDRNKDGAITTHEAIKAYPAFKGLMLEMAADQLKSGKIKESELLDVFTFILNYGKPPTTLVEQARFMFKWKGKRDKWDIWADRYRLAQILGYVAAQVNAAEAQ